MLRLHLRQNRWQNVDFGVDRQSDRMFSDETVPNRVPQPHRPGNPVGEDPLQTVTLEFIVRMHRDEQSVADFGVDDVPAEDAFPHFEVSLEPQIGEFQQNEGQKNVAAF